MILLDFKTEFDNAGFHQRRNRSRSRNQKQNRTDGITRRTQCKIRRQKRKNQPITFFDSRSCDWLVLDHKRNRKKLKRSDSSDSDYVSAYDSDFPFSSRDYDSDFVASENQPRYENENRPYAVLPSGWISLSLQQELFDALMYQVMVVPWWLVEKMVRWSCGNSTFNKKVSSTISTLQAGEKPVTSAVPSPPWNRDSRMAQGQELKLGSRVFVRREVFVIADLVVQPCDSHLKEICVEDYSLWIN